MKDEEKLELSKAYKKGFNHADLIITTMPKELEKISKPTGEEHTEYIQGFEDRVKQFELEKDSLKGFSVDQLKEKYKDDLDRYNDKGSLDRSKD